jgi:hypothetical protein
VSAPCRRGLIPPVSCCYVVGCSAGGYAIVGGSARDPDNVRVPFLQDVEPSTHQSFARFAGNFRPS